MFTGGTVGRARVLHVDIANTNRAEKGVQKRGRPTAKTPVGRGLPKGFWISAFFAVDCPF